MALNVMVVDDSTVTRAMVIKTLRLSGLDLGEVVEAANGLEGLQRLREHGVDLVLTDINMPEMDGEEMIRQIRACPDWAHLRVVVISTEGSRPRIERLEHYGARFVHKPFSPETIRDVVSDLAGADHV